MKDKVKKFISEHKKAIAITVVTTSAAFTVGAIIASKKTYNGLLWTTADFDTREDGTAFIEVLHKNGSNSFLNFPEEAV